jgi:hypothetical protein
MDVKLVSVETADSIRLDGVLRGPEVRGAASMASDAVIFHHGIGGNLYNASFSLRARASRPPGRRPPVHGPRRPGSAGVPPARPPPQGPPSRLV